jgi:AraC-like DNA-binding protein
MMTCSFTDLKDIRVEVSVTHPTGRGARNSDVLLYNPPFYLDGQPLSEFLTYRSKTYDTYDGHNQAEGEDWYALYFPKPIKINCVEMTMECPNRDGGWWTSLRVEYWDNQHQNWQNVCRLEITPPYNFNDVPYDRRPYETHALMFDEVITHAVRLIGRPGGLAQFTSLSYLAVCHRDLSRWTPASLPKPPIPYIFQLIPPNTIWDLSESLVKLTGLSINVAYMDHYLDRERYQRWWQRISHNYQGKPELWQLLGARIGWDRWNQIENPPSDITHESHVRISFHNTIGRAIAPIVVDHQILGEMMSHQVILTDGMNWDWHKAYAGSLDIPWEAYQAAIKRSPHMSLEQLEGAAELMGMIANTIANLAHRNLSLERELVGVRSAAEQRMAEREEIIRKAIAFIEANLEQPITVADVAREVALSTTYFGILFTEHIGRNPIDYLIDLRIERAKKYLAHTKMSVMDVCVALGYNPSYFNRLFKRQTGYTPGQYARKFQEHT